MLLKKHFSGHRVAMNLEFEKQNKIKKICEAQ
jgi:hypothetical protein